MNVIVLAGGFAKRMWPLTKNKPKHLLDVAGKPMLSYTLDPLVDFDGIDRIFVSTNSAFSDRFRDFLDVNYDGDNIELVVEPTGGLGYLVEEKGLSSDTMIIGGDNLFEFRLSEPVEVFREKGLDLVAVYDVRDQKKATLYGIVDVDSDGIIRDFLEKPEEPPSTLAATAFYIFTGDTIRSVPEYLSEGGKRDALGHYINYLVKNKRVMAWKFQGKWFDIGSTESYREADDHFRSKK
jgi:glucose-1-phosphate thymidylyltransferase